MPLQMAAMACSRTPKCRLEPVRSSAEKSPRPFMLDLLEGARSAEPPIRFGMRLARRLSTSPEEARVALGPSNFQYSSSFMRSTGSFPEYQLLYSAASSG